MNVISAFVLVGTSSIVVCCQKTYMLKLSPKAIHYLWKHLDIGNQFTITQHWYRQWLSAQLVTSHFLNQWWPNLLKHIRVTWPQWVNQSPQHKSPSSINCPQIQQALVCLLVTNNDPWLSGLSHPPGGRETEHIGTYKGPLHQCWFQAWAQPMRDVVTK